VEYCIHLTMNYSNTFLPPTTPHTPLFQDLNIHDIYCENSRVGYFLEGLDDSEINANFWNIHIRNYTMYLYTECTNIYGSCDNSTVFPHCPPCIAKTICEDTTDDCLSYLGQCNNPAYRKFLLHKGPNCGWGREKIGHRLE
jgi:hypothetical protein